LLQTRTSVEVSEAVERHS